MTTIEIAGRNVGPSYPTFVIAEIGINHNGDLEIAKQLIDAAKAAGCDAVKFQKRTPEECVPDDQRDVMRETPWGRIPYLDYRHRLEFKADDYEAIDEHCREAEIAWFASAWDEGSVAFLENYDLPCHKIPSACLTNQGLVRTAVDTERPLILSTGMSTWEEIEVAVELVPNEQLLIAHCTSTYPCPPAELNLRTIQTLASAFQCPVGYSGHEVGLQTSVAAVVLGACFVERHITLDRAMWGSDQAASVEPGGFARLVRDIRVVERAVGDGKKILYASEEEARKRLRKSGLRHSGCHPRHEGRRSSACRPSTLGEPTKGQVRDAAKHG